jgi:hypothetical protein
MFDILSLFIMLYIIFFVILYISEKMFDIIIQLSKQNPEKARKILFLFILFIVIICIILYRI